MNELKRKIQRVRQRDLIKKLNELHSKWNYLLSRLPQPKEHPTTVNFLKENMWEVLDLKDKIRAGSKKHDYSQEVINLQGKLNQFVRQIQTAKKEDRGIFHKIKNKFFTQSDSNPTPV